MRKLAVLLVLTTLLVGVSVSTAGATSTPGLQCGDTITASVRLRADLICPDSPAFSVQSATPITIDLNGHTLHPGISQDDVGTVTVQHGTLDGSITFLRFGGGSVAVRFARVNGDIGNPGGGSLDLRNSTINGNIQIRGATNTISRNVIRGGIRVDDSDTGLTLSITGNLISRSGAAGIAIVMFGPAGFPDDVSGTIAYNAINGAAGSGIDISGEVRNLGSLTVKRNTLAGNGGDGLRLRGDFADLPSAAPGGPVTVAGNIAFHNHGRGVDLVWTEGSPSGIVDGGGNIALFNRVRPQCVGVSCWPSH